MKLLLGLCVLNSIVFCLAFTCPKLNGYVADSAHSSSYYLCLLYVPIKLNCDPGETYDIIAGECRSDIMFRVDVPEPIMSSTSDWTARPTPPLISDLPTTTSFTTARPTPPLISNLPTFTTTRMPTPPLITGTHIPTPPLISELPTVPTPPLIIDTTANPPTPPLISGLPTMSTTPTNPTPPWISEDTTISAPTPPLISEPSTVPTPPWISEDTTTTPTIPTPPWISDLPTPSVVTTTPSSPTPPWISEETTTNLPTSELDSTTVEPPLTELPDLTTTTVDYPTPPVVTTTSTPVIGTSTPMTPPHITNYTIASTVITTARPTPPLISDLPTPSVVTTTPTPEYINGTARTSTVPTPEYIIETTLDDQFTIPTTTEPPPSLPIECPESGMHRHVHPQYCNRFFLCSNGASFEVTCPPGEIFDYLKLYCEENGRCHINSWVYG